MLIFNKKHIFFVSVLEKEILNNFINFSLPTLFLDKNLGILNNSIDTHFIILTNKCGKERIEKSVIFRIVKSKIIIKFWVLERPINYIINTQNKILNYFQNRLLSVIDQYDFIHFLYPDFIYGNGTFLEIFKKLNKGHSGFLIPIPSLNKKKFKKMFSNLFNTSISKNFGRLSEEFNNNLYTKKINDLLTDFQKSFFLDESFIANSPSSLMWKIKNEKNSEIQSSILIKSFFPQPISLKIQKDNYNMIKDFRTYLNKNYIANLYADISDLWIAESSDQAVISKLDDHYKSKIEKLNNYDKLLKISRFVENETTIVHRQFIKKDYIWLTGQMDRESYKNIIQTTSKLTEKIEQRTLIPDQILKQNDISSFKNRILGLNQFKDYYLKKRGMPSFVYLWNKEEFIIALLIFQIYSFFHYFKQLENLRILRSLFYEYGKKLKILKNHPKIFEKFRILARLCVANENTAMNIRMYDLWLLFFEKFKILTLLEEVSMLKVFVRILRGDKNLLKNYSVPPIFKGKN